MAVINVPKRTKHACWEQNWTQNRAIPYPEAHQKRTDDTYINYEQILGLFSSQICPEILIHL